MLLSTKLSIPQLRADLVARPQLIEKLNAGLNGRLTLISAPAGFGKTTLVNAWLNQLPIPTHPWASAHSSWISLDENDNQADRFLRYFLAAVQVVYPGLVEEQLETIENSPKPNLSAITQDWLNIMAAHNKPLLIILDDFHEIQHEEIHQLLQMIIDFLPSQVHIVITTRQDPPFTLPRWRARSWLNEITAFDLRFDQIETAEFLQHTMNLDLDAEAVALLEERTEGWVAGLQLAALSLVETEFSSESIREFGGRDRYVADYLLAEVLNRQTEEEQGFMLATALLDRFNADLCYAVIPTEPKHDRIEQTQHFQQIIEGLERANLFITPLDREGYWFRYHHLFSQLLRQRLERLWPQEKIYEIYRRAARWFADKEFLEDAINHALKGQDFTFTAQLISGFEVDSLWNQTLGLQLRKWGAELPTEVLKEFPRAALHIGIAHMTRNEVSESIRIYELIKDDPRVEAEILLIDSIFHRNKGELDRALELAHEASSFFEGPNETFYIAAQIQVLVCLMEVGKLANAEDLASALMLKMRSNAGELLNAYIQLIHITGLIKEIRGKLVEAERLYLDGIEAIEQSGLIMPLIGLLQVRLGAIYYQWNDIEKATEYGETGIAWGERTGIADITTHGLFVRINLAIYRQDKQAVAESLGYLSDLLNFPEFTDFGPIINASQAEFQVRQGELAPAVRWANASGFNLDDKPSMRNRTEYQSLLRVRLEELLHLGINSQAQKVVKLADRLIELGNQHSLRELEIYCVAIKALLLKLNGQSISAVDSLHEALNLAQPGGYIRTFLDLAAPMRELLENSLPYEPFMIYKRRLLMAFHDDSQRDTNPVESDLVIPVSLTPREHEILQLIATGLSNKAIETHLVLSKNTVRSHIKNLYSKLGVHSRTEAVQQARENGLI